jgi:hypothetical protein
MNFVIWSILFQIPRYIIVLIFKSLKQAWALPVF